MRDFKASASYATIEACLSLGPRDIRNSGATSSVTFEDEEEVGTDEDAALAPVRDEDGSRFRSFRDQKEDARPKSHMSEAHEHVADWYGIADDVHSARPKTWG